MTVTEFSQILNTYSSNGAPKFRQILNTVSSLKWSTIPSMTATWLQGHQHQRREICTRTQVFGVVDDSIAFFFDLSIGTEGL